MQSIRCIRNDYWKRATSGWGAWKNSSPIDREAETRIPHVFLDLLSLGGFYQGKTSIKRPFGENIFWNFHQHRRVANLSFRMWFFSCRFFDMYGILGGKKRSIFWDIPLFFVALKILRGDYSWKFVVVLVVEFNLNMLSEIKSKQYWRNFGIPFGPNRSFGFFWVFFTGFMTCKSTWSYHLFVFVFVFAGPKSCPTLVIKHPPGKQSNHHFQKCQTGEDMWSFPGGYRTSQKLRIGRNCPKKEVLERAMCSLKII